jgi:hypothetical protein
MPTNCFLRSAAFRGHGPLLPWDLIMISTHSYPHVRGFNVLREGSPLGRDTSPPMSVEYTPASFCRVGRAFRPNRLK